ncbi:MAG: 1-acyl-sn-glycerol-3-phosphate acyltransferase [Crocinitomicaceae bacterium]|nr:1-acyl-sn-glycerol-3-phosphate acyltransferase [Crocinitomicaceae bacterium]
MILKKDIFGQYIFLRRLIIRVLGTFLYFRFNFVLRSRIRGAERIKNLPDRKVLFVSNHQTYFSDVSFFYHVFYSALRGYPNNIRYPGYLFCKKQNIFYVAAEETMKSGLLPKILALTGAVTVNRTWRANGENVRRKVDRSETAKIDTAIENGWVVTFPQGTTKAFAPGRIGTAILIKKHKPLVVPLKIDGFRRSFDKKGMLIKKKKSTLQLTVQDPLDIDYDKTVEEILEQVMDSIGQSKKHDFVGQLKIKEEE